MPIEQPEFSAEPRRAAQASDPGGRARTANELARATTYEIRRLLVSHADNLKALNRWRYFRKKVMGYEQDSKAYIMQMKNLVALCATLMRTLLDRELNKSISPEVDTRLVIIYDDLHLVFNNAERYIKSGDIIDPCTVELKRLATVMQDIISSISSSQPQRDNAPTASASAAKSPAFGTSPADPPTNNDPTPGDPPNVITP